MQLLLFPTVKNAALFDASLIVCNYHRSNRTTFKVDENETFVEKSKKEKLKIICSSF